MAISEFQVLGLVLSGGQAGGAPVGEEMLAKVLAKKEIKTVGGDCIYDSDAIRTRLPLAGKEAVIPPRSNRTNPLDQDKESTRDETRVNASLTALNAIALWPPATTNLLLCSKVAYSPPRSLSA